jgi:Glutathione-dependent formaldehyde-activating enzyme
VTITKGAAKEHWTLSEKGSRIARLFCGQCGTPLFAKNESHPEFLPVKVGSLDDPRSFRPQANIWTKSAQPWHFLDAAIPQFERDPKMGTTAMFEIARSSLVRLGRVVGLLSKQSERRPLGVPGLAPPAA